MSYAQNWKKCNWKKDSTTHNHCSAESSSREEQKNRARTGRSVIPELLVNVSIRKWMQKTMLFTKDNGVLKTKGFKRGNGKWIKLPCTVFYLWTAFQAGDQAWKPCSDHRLWGVFVDPWYSYTIMKYINHYNFYWKCLQHQRNCNIYIKSISLQTGTKSHTGATWNCSITVPNHFT